MEKRIIPALVGLLFSAQLMAAPKVIYGDDNRIDVYESKDSALVELSKSTAAMIPSSNMKKSFWSNEYTIKGRTLENRGICKSERFSNQISAANCSAFLVGDKYMVTAGHCIESQSDCNSNFFVFDFKMDSASTINLKPSEDNVYKCKKIISRELSSWNKDDYALIELDREVVGRRPLSFRKSGKIEVGANIAVIGHPTGIPTKITDGAVVRSRSGKYFTTNLDTYGGNSGSAVFNLDTHEVEGILVRGDTDYVRNGGCQVSNRIGNEAGRGEDVTFITNIKELQNL